QNNIGTPSVSRSVSPTRTTTYTILSVMGNGCSGTTSGAATITVIPPTPTALVATLSGDGSTINVSWESTGADSYVIQRSFNNAAYVDWATASTASFADTDPKIPTRG